MKQEIKAIASSLFRLSLTAMFGVIIAHGGIYDIDWKEVLGAGGFAAAMVLYNYFNADNKNYGKGAQHEKHS